MPGKHTAKCAASVSTCVQLESVTLVHTSELPVQKYEPVSLCLGGRGLKGLCFV